MTEDIQITKLITAIRVPGGLLFRTHDVWRGGVSVALQYVPCPDLVAKRFIELGELP